MSPRVTVIPGETEYPAAMDAPELIDPDVIVTNCFFLVISNSMKSYKGKFKPKNPSRYKGDPTNIIYRSSWEAKFMKYLDEHPDVIYWASEELVVPYRSPVDGKMHRYFPDFLVRKKDPKGVIETVLVEIKSASQTVEPVKKKNDK